MAASGDIVSIGVFRGDDPELLSTILTYRVAGDALTPLWDFPIYTPDGTEDEEHIAEDAFNGISADGSALVIHSQLSLWAFDLETGEVIWRATLPAWRNTSIGAVITGGTIIDTTFGGPAVVAFSIEDRIRPILEIEPSDIFGDDGQHREVVGPVVAGRLIVEGKDVSGNLVVAAIPVG